MPDRTITTSTGTTVTLAERRGDTVILLDHPNAPADMRNTEAGRIVDGSFQPAIFAAWSMQPEALRTIADLIDQPAAGDTGTRAIGEPNVEQLRRLLADLTDPDDCDFDHHGGCQAHGYLTLKPGELCPHAEAKQLLAEGGE